MQQLTDLQIEIQKLGADKSLSFGCIVRVADSYYRYLDYHNAFDLRTNTVWEVGKVFDDKKEIIGHPITRGRLCYLNYSRSITEGNIDLLIDIDNKFNAIETYMNNNTGCYDQTILEWSLELQNKVRDFLLTL